jgi:hypothetical protein
MPSEATWLGLYKIVIEARWRVLACPYTTALALWLNNGAARLDLGLQETVSTGACGGYSETPARYWKAVLSVLHLYLLAM